MNLKKAFGGGGMASPLLVFGITRFARDPLSGTYRRACLMQACLPMNIENNKMPTLLSAGQFRK